MVATERYSRRFVRQRLSDGAIERRSYTCSPQTNRQSIGLRHIAGDEFHTAARFHKHIVPSTSAQDGYLGFPPGSLTIYRHRTQYGHYCDVRIDRFRNSYPFMSIVKLEQSLRSLAANLREALSVCRYEQEIDVMPALRIKAHGEGHLVNTKRRTNCTIA